MARTLQVPWPLRWFQREQIGRVGLESWVGVKDECTKASFTSTLWGCQGWNLVDWLACYISLQFEKSFLSPKIKGSHKRQLVILWRLKNYNSGCLVSSRNLQRVLRKDECWGLEWEERRWDKWIGKELIHWSSFPAGWSHSYATGGSLLDVVWLTQVVLALDCTWFSTVLSNVHSRQFP